MSKIHYILRVNSLSNTSYGGFQYPSEEGAIVQAPDWDPKPECGNGLHGWLRGAGDIEVSNYHSESNAIWMIIKVKKYVDLGGKIKFPKGKIIKIGKREEVIKKMKELCPDSPVHYATQVAGDNGTATAGDYGRATAGDNSQATAGDCGRATAGNYGQATAGYKGRATAGDYGRATAGDCGRATAGDCGTATVGDNSQAIAGDCGRATAGNYGQATAGDHGTATAGNYGQATAGNEGTATAGDYGIATAGNDGLAKAGEYGVISIWYCDKYRLLTGYIGEGLESDVFYKVENGKFVKV